MPMVRVLDNNNDLLFEVSADSAENEGLAQEFLALGYNVLVDADIEPQAPAPALPVAHPATPVTGNQALAVVNQSVVDFHAGAQQLMSLALEQTRQWLALSARIVDEDLRRRELMHKAIKDLDIADRSIGVLELQAKQQAWAPAPSPAPAPAQEDGITNFLGAVSTVGKLGKQLFDLDKKN